MFDIFNRDVPEYEQYDPTRHRRNPIWGFDIETNRIGNVSGAAEFPLSIAFQQVQRRGDEFRFGQKGINTLVYPPGTTSENYVPVLEKILGEKIKTGRNRGKTIGELTGLNLEDWATRGALTQEELAARIDELVRSGRGMPVFLGQNIQRFDLRVLSGLLERTGHEPLRNALKYDTWERVRAFDKARGKLNNTSRYNLASLAERFEIPYTMQHEAESDLSTTLAVANAFERQRYYGFQESRPPMTPPALSNISQLTPGVRLPPSGVRGVRRNYDPSYENFSDFISAVRGQLTGASAGAPNEVDVISFENEGFARFAIRSPNERNPIVMDLAPGPRDLRGMPTIVEHYPSGWFGHWEPQIFAKSETDLELTSSGLETLGKTVQAAFTSQSLMRSYPDSPQKRFNILKYEGSAESGIVGRHQQQGPPHPSTAISYAASRMSIGYAENVDPRLAEMNIMRQIQDAALRVHAGVVKPNDIKTLRWAELAGYVPTKEDSQNLSRLTPLYRPYVDNGRLMVESLGRGGIDPIKRQTLMMTGRERAFFYEVDQAGTTMTRATPEEITGTSWKKTAGLRYATIPEYGETERDYSVVVPNTVMTTATPLSGAMMLYKDPLKTGAGKRIATAAYSTSGTVPLPNLEWNQLRDIRFTMGEMQEYTNEAGEIDYRLVDEKRKGLAGLTLAENKTHVLGYYQFGGEGPKTPILYNTRGAPVTINEEPVLHMPSHYLPGGAPSSGVVYDEREGTPLSVVEQGYDTMLQKTNPGLRVRATGQEDQLMLQFDVGLWTGFGGKGWAGKQSIEEMPTMDTSRRNREAIRPHVTLASQAGGSERFEAAAITGEIKDYTQAFAAAYRYTEPQTQIAWMGELSRLESENPNYAKAATALQAQLKRGMVGGRQTVRPEALATTYAREMYGIKTNFEIEDYSRGRLMWTEMMAGLRRSTEEMMSPTSAYKQYGWAKMGSQWVDQRATTTGERAHLMQSALGAAALRMAAMSEQLVSGQTPKGFSQEQTALWNSLREQYPSGLPDFLNESGKVTREGLRAFKQIYPQGMKEFVKWEKSGNAAAPWIMSMRTGQEAIFGKQVLYPTSEFMGKPPHIGLEEVLGLETQYQEIAEFMGMTTKLGPEGPARAGTGHRTDRIRAYQQMADVVRYAHPRLGESMPLPGRVVKPEQAQEILRWMATQGSQEDLPFGTDMDALQAKVAEVLGTEKDPYTNEPLVLPGAVTNPKRVGAGMVSPKTMRDLSYSPFPWESEYYNPVDKLSKGYLRAFTGFLEEAAGHETRQETERFEGEAWNLFKDSTDILKSIQSYQVAGGISGRYGAATGIGMGTSIISQANLDRMLSAVGGAAGISGKNFNAWRSAAMAQIREMGGVPSLDTRYPFQSREAGYFASMAMTPELLAEKTGVHFREATQLVGRQILPGSPYSSGIGARLSLGSTAFSGDWDYDTLMKLGIIAANPKFGQEGESALLIPSQIMDMMAMTEKQRSGEVYQAFRGFLGTGAGHPGGAKDVLAAQWADIMNTVSPFVQPKHGTSRGFTGTATEPYEKAFTDAMAYIAGGKGGMGAEFNMQRLLTSVSASMGTGAKIRTVSGMHYQTPLDFMYDVYEKRGGQSRLQTMLQSAVYATEGDKQSAQLIYMPHAKSRHTKFWGENTPQQLLVGQMTSAVEADYEEMISDVGIKMPKEFMGSLFAMRDRPEDIGWLSERFEMERAKKKEDAMYRAITGEGGYEDYLSQQTGGGGNPLRFNLYDTTIGRAMHISAGMKITPYRPGRKEPRLIEVANASNQGTTQMETLQGIGGRTFEIAPGQRMMLSDMMADPTNRAAMITYTNMTRGGILPPEDVGVIQNLMQQRIAEGKPIPPEWRYISALYGGERDLAVIKQAQMAQTARYTPEQILRSTQADLAPRVKLTASQLPKFASEDFRALAGVETGWVSKEYERVLAKNSQQMAAAGVSGERLDELFDIGMRPQVEGAAFQKYVGERLSKDPRFKDLTLDVARGVGPEVNLENVLTPKELDTVGRDYKVALGMTPDIIGMQAGGRAYVGEAKKGGSQAVTGQLQAFTYAFMLQRLAGYDPVTGNKFSQGGWTKFRQAIQPMFAAHNTAYQALDPKGREAMLKEYWNAFKEGNVDIELLKGTGIGGTVAAKDEQGNVIIDSETGTPMQIPGGWRMKNEPLFGKGMLDQGTLYESMLDALRGGLDVYRDPGLASQANAGLYQRLLEHPGWGIPPTAAMTSARRKTPQAGTHPVYGIPLNRNVPTAAPGGPGDRGPGGPEVTVGGTEQEPPSGGGRRPGGGKSQSFYGDVGAGIDYDKMEAAVYRAQIRASKELDGGAGGGSRTIVTGTDSQHAAWRKRLATFEDLFEAARVQQEESKASAGRIGLADLGTAFSQHAAGGLVTGDVGEMIQEAQKDPRRLRSFLQKNWGLISQGANIAKAAGTMATNLGKVEQAILAGQPEPQNELTAQLSAASRVAILATGGYSMRSDIVPENVQGQTARLGQGAYLAGRLKALASTVGLGSTGKMTYGPPVYGHDVLQEQAGLMFLNESMLRYGGAQFHQLSAAQRKEYLAEDSLAVSQWQTEAYRAKRAAMLSEYPEGGLPAYGSEGYARLAQTQSQLKRAQDTELRRSEQYRQARAEAYAASVSAEPMAYGSEQAQRMREQAFLEQVDAWQREAPGQPRAPKYAQGAAESWRKWRTAKDVSGVQREVSLGVLEGYKMLDAGMFRQQSLSGQWATASALMDPTTRDEALLPGIIEQLPKNVRGAYDAGKLGGSLKEIASSVEMIYGRKQEALRAAQVRGILAEQGGTDAEAANRLRAQYIGLQRSTSQWGAANQLLQKTIDTAPQQQEEIGKLIQSIEQRIGLTFQAPVLEEEQRQGALDYQRNLDIYSRQVSRGTALADKRVDIEHKYLKKPQTERNRVEKAYEEAMATYANVAREVGDTEDVLVDQLKSSSAIKSDAGKNTRKLLDSYKTASASRKVEIARAIEQDILARAKTEDVSAELEGAAGLRESAERGVSAGLTKEAATQDYKDYTQFGRLPGLARKMFGGFGLMYMQSIAGLVTTGAYTGYGERQQYEAEMAQQFLGAGGLMPVTPAEERQRILATQYGGSGGLLMGSAKNMLMRDYQGVYQFGTTALSGISAGGMAMWLSEAALGNKKQATALGAGVGALTMVLNQGMNIAGAMEDVPGTAMSMAVRRARGDNLTGQVLASIGAGALTMGGTGAMIGSSIAPGIGTAIGAGIGAIAGGILGFTSNYQQIAEMASPEIQRQAEIIEALGSRGSASIESVLSGYGISRDQAPYYARLAAQFEAAQQQNLGISEAAIAAAGAWTLRTGASLNESQRQLYARQLQGGFDPGAMAGAMARTLGYSIADLYGLSTRPLPPITTTAISPIAGMSGMASLGTTSLAGIMSPTSITSVIAPAVPPVTPSLFGATDLAGIFESLGVRDAFSIARATAPETTTTATAETPTMESMYGSWSEAMSTWAAQQGYSETTASDLVSAAAQAVGAFGVSGMRGALGAIGEIGTAITPEQIQSYVEYGNRLAGIQAQGWGEAYNVRRQAWALRQALGYEAGPEPTIEEYEGLPANEVEAQRQMLAAEQSMLIPNMARQAVNTYTTAFGVAPTALPTTGTGIQTFMGQVSYGQQIGQQMLYAGYTEESAQAVGQAIANLNPEQFYGVQGLTSMQPMRVAEWAMTNPQAAAQLMAGGALPGAGGTQVNPMNLALVDVNAQGMMTGLPYGTTSLANPMEVSALMAGGMIGAEAANMSAANQAVNIWGANWANEGASEWREAFVFGGQYGAQAYQQREAARAQAASAGNQLAMLALQAEYMPKFWALEDRSRALGYQQTEWGFAQQERQLEMSQRFFYQNLGVQQTQTQLQRGWTKEDWATDEQMRAMQWGWKVEDFEEQSRFMTGRQRKVAERQMERETTVHTMEEERIDKQKSRQKELWALEDQRFNLQIAQFQEQQAMQEENLKKQREFFEERKKIEAEQTALQREYWQKQHDLQVAAAGAQAAYARQQMEIAQDQLDAMQYLNEEAAQANLANPDTVSALAEALGLTVGPLSDMTRVVLDVMDYMRAHGEDLGYGNLNCFVAGTSVVMEDHTLRPIEDIREGDKVLSYNQVSKQVEPKLVSRTIKRTVENTVTVSLPGGVYTCSAEHPWYTRRGWVHARRLKEDDEIKTLDGDWEEIEGLTYSAVYTDVYNITVLGNGNYYVDKYLTHNVAQKAVGGPIQPNELTVVGENGPELLKLPYPASILPNSVLQSMTYGATTFSDPWNVSAINQTTTMSTPGVSGQPIVLILNIGNERLDRFVLKAVSQSLEV